MRECVRGVRERGAGECVRERRCVSVRLSERGERESEGKREGGE